MVALVTGGYRGIGLGIATALAHDGHDVVVTGRRGADEAAGALESLRAGGRQAEYVQADGSAAADRRRLVEFIDQRFGRLDVLVNNAGIAPRVRADLLEATEESFDELMAINLKGPYFLTQLVAQRMVRQRQADPKFRGCIINVSSCSATVVSVNRGDYCISKAGVAMATRLWTARLAEYGIDVYEIRPGISQTMSFRFVIRAPMR